MLINTSGELTAVPGSPGGPGSPGKPTGPYRQNETTRHWAALRVTAARTQWAAHTSQRPSCAIQLTYRVTLWTVISRGSSGAGGSSSSRWASVSLLTRLPSEALSRNMPRLRTTTAQSLMQEDQTDVVHRCCRHRLHITKWMNEAEMCFFILLCAYLEVKLCVKTDLHHFFFQVQHNEIIYCCCFLVMYN